jgi:VWFA-related protein
MSTLSLVLTASLLGATAAGLQSQGVVFSSKVEAVRVDVLVTDRDKAVVGLKPADFEVLDNGVPQQVDLVSFEQIRLNVVLALDMSESVSGDRLGQLRDASSGLLGVLTKDDQAGLVTFTERVVLGSTLTKDLDKVRQAMEPLHDPGDTSIMAASFAAMMLASRCGRTRDRVQRRHRHRQLAQRCVLNTAKRSDVVVYAVSVQSRLKPEFLRELTAATGGRLYEIEKTANLSQVFLSVLEEFRHRYLISYTPSGVDRGGWHKLDVSIKGRKAVVKARPGYLGAS